MLMSGELMSVIDSIDFNTKDELLKKLREMRDSTVKFSPKKRVVIKQIIGISIQQVYFTKESELLNYKKYLSERKNSMKRS